MSGWAKTPTPVATIPRDVLERALRKARAEYVRVNVLQGTDPGPDDECWAEFEALAEAAKPKSPSWLGDFRGKSRG